MQQTPVTILLPPQYSAPPPPPPSPSSSSQSTPFRRKERAFINRSHQSYLPHTSSYLFQVGAATSALFNTSATNEYLSDAPNGYMNLQQYNGCGVYPTYSQGVAQYDNAHQTLPQRQLISYDDLTPASGQQQQQWKGGDTWHQGQLGRGGSQHRSEPEGEPQFNCDACDKSFHTNVQYVTHIKSHRKCTQCEFAASGKLVEIHEEETHGMIREGKRKMDRPDGRMPMYAISLDSPEEIAKWIEERKKMWPSEANIARKQKEEQERIARGEVLPNNNSRKRNRDEFDHGGRGGRGGRGRFTRGGGRGGYGGWRTSLEGKCDGGPLDLAAAASAVDQTGPEPNANPLSLISGYGSDREEDREDDQEPETTSSKDPASIGKIALREEGECDENGRKIRRIDRPCKYFMKGRCNKGDKCMFRHDTADRKRSGPPKSVEIFRTRPNLLNMLLAKEIKQEKNVLLQCLRYIVQNKFFDHEVA